MTVGTFFDGTNDWIRSDTGTDITADNITVAAMVYVAAVDASRYVATWRVSGTGSALRIGNGGAWIWYDGSSSAVGPSATDDAWQLVIVSKATGTTTPRFHIYNGTSWSHTNAGSANGNMSGALTEIRLGADIDGSAPFSGEIATVGLWNETTDDSTAETYLSYTTLAAKSNARFFTGESLISGGTMNDSGSGNNDETSRQGATTGSQTVPSWFTSFGANVNVNAQSAAVTVAANAPTITRTDPYVVANAGAAVTAVDDASVTFSSYTPLENDVIVFFISSTTTMGIVVDGSLPSGWVNPLGSGVEINSDGHGMGCVYHKVTSAEQTAVELTYTATNVLDAAETGYVQAVAVRNVDPANVIDGSGTAFDSANTVTPHVLAGITGSGVLIAGSLVVSSVAKDATGDYGASAPAGWTRVRNDNTNNGRWVGYRDTHTVLDTNVAATNITPSAGDEYVSITLALARVPAAATNVNAESAAVAVTANNPSHTNSTGPTSAAVAVTANNPVAAPSASASSAAVTVTANNPQHINSTGPTSAAVTVTANNPSAAVAVNATSAAVTVAGNNATVVATIAAAAGNAPVSVTANDPSGAVAPTPTTAAVTVTANNPTISAGADTNVNAESAAVTVTGNDPGSSVKPSATSAAVTITGNDPDPVPSIAATAGNATVTVTSNDATHTIALGADSAPVSVTGNNPSITTSSSTNVNAESAAVTVTGNNATITLAIEAQAGVASVAVAANNAAVAVAVAAMVAIVTVTANDASTIDASIGATTLTPLVQVRRPGVIRLDRTATVDRTRPGV